MKKIFEAIKKFVTKAVDKAKELWKKAKEWFSRNREDIIMDAKITAMAAGVAFIWYHVGRACTLTDSHVQDALKWYDDPMSKDLRKSGFADLVCRKNGASRVDELGNGITIFKWGGTDDYVKFDARPGVAAPTLADFGSIGQAAIDNGYSPDQKVYGAAMTLGAVNCNWV